MNELCSTAEMVERIKDILSIPLEKQGQKKVFNKDVADVLGIDQMNLASMKKRNSPPLKEIILFCDRSGLDPRDFILKHS